MDELEKELIDDVVAEAPELQAQLATGMEALLQGRDGVETAIEALETLEQRAGFIEHEPLERLVAQIRLALKAVAAGTPAPAAAAPVLDAASAALAATLTRLQGYELVAAYSPTVSEALDAVADGRVPAAPGDGETAGREEEMSPEGLVASIRVDAGDDPLPVEDGEDDEDDEAAQDQASAHEEPPAAAPPPIAAAPIELETVEVVEGPVSADIADFLGDFLTEAGEIIEALDEQLVHLEDAGDDLELLNEIFRAAHTLKGTSAFLGFAQMADLTHKMENVLDLLRKEELTLSPAIMDVILRGVDQIKVLIGDIRGGRIVRRDLDAVRRDLVAIAQTGVPGEAPAAPPAPEAPAAPEAAAPPGDTPPTLTQAGAPTAKPPAPARPAPARDVDQVIRVDLDRIDKIMNLAEELVLGRNRLLQLNSQLESEQADEVVRRLSEATSHVGMLTGELQEAVMTMRMIPVSRVFSRFPRMVRDLSRDLDKQIELVLEDNDTEIDKSVADEIGDPLIHLIRNAVDHGVETPVERQAAGKDAKGIVVLSATHEGNHIVIRIRDDGKGMDPEVLKEKAVEKGLIAAAEAQRLTDEEAYNLIFAPGFSTAQKVTGVSGRGVGMDVVKTNISRLSGTIQLTSEQDVGTEVTIRLPLTLAIIGGLQVAAGAEVYILPLTSVIEAVKIGADQVETVRGDKAIVSRDQVLPLIDLREVLCVDDPAEAEQVTRYVVIAGVAERRVGVLVDRLLGQVDVVIKALGDFVGPATGIAGATILGDGNISLILDIGQLLDQVAQAASGISESRDLRA